MPAACQAGHVQTVAPRGPGDRTKGLLLSQSCLSVSSLLKKVWGRLAERLCPRKPRILEWRQSNSKGAPAGRFLSMIEPGLCQWDLAVGPYLPKSILFPASHCCQAQLALALLVPSFLGGPHPSRPKTFPLPLSPEHNDINDG